MHNEHPLHATTRRAKIARSSVLFATVALSGCGGISRDDEDTFTPTELQDFQPAIEIETVWSRRVVSGTGGRHLNLSPAAGGGRVFAAGHDGAVAAYDALAGKRLWETDTGVPVSGGPGMGSGLVVVGSSDGDVVALAGTDGAIAWRARVSSEVLSTPAVGERIVVVRTIDGKLFGLDTANGERIWVYDRTVPVLTLRGTSSPVIAGDVVIAGFDSGRLVAVLLADGRLAWESRVATPTGRTELERLVDIDADPVVSDDVVYAATSQGPVAAFDLYTGRLLWQQDLASHAGIGAGRLLYVTDDEGRVWALDRDSGAWRWRQDGLKWRGATRPAEIGEYVVVADFEGYVHWLSIDDGRFVARARTGGSAVTASPVATGTTVYVLGANGSLTALTLP